MAAPMLIAAFVAIIALTSIVQHRAVLGAAASMGVRVASAYGASDVQGRRAATDVLVSHGLDSARSEVTITHPHVNGVSLVQVTVASKVRVPWLNRVVSMVQSARAVDEGTL